MCKTMNKINKHFWNKEKVVFRTNVSGTKVTLSPCRLAVAAGRELIAPSAARGRTGPRPGRATRTGARWTAAKRT